jgi:hypothetical protein
VRDLVRGGRPVLLVDAFQTGSAKAPRDQSHEHFLTFNKTDDANRVQDILTALAYLKTMQPGAVELVGIGKAAVWAEFAAAIAPSPVKLTADLGGFNGSDQAYLDGFFVPGVQRAGGLDIAKKLASAR